MYNFKGILFLQKSRLSSRIKKRFRSEYIKLLIHLYSGRKKIAKRRTNENSLIRSNLGTSNLSQFVRYDKARSRRWASPRYELIRLSKKLHSGSRATGAISRLRVLLVFIRWDIFRCGSRYSVRIDLSPGEYTRLLCARVYLSPPETRA